jgi:hypothetical protein
MWLMSTWDSSGQAVTETRFYGEVLRSLNYSIERGSGEQRRKRAVGYVVDQARKFGENRSLMFVDEAQWLNQKMFNLLMDFHNQIAKEGVRLIVILVGQPEILDERRKLISTGQGHIIGRFMAATHQFTGVTCRDDIYKMCDALDQGSEYPVGSGVTYTCFFVPQGYRSGFRMAQYADVIWAALQREASEANLRRNIEYPMQAIVAVLRVLMREISTRDEPGLQLEEAVVRSIIRNVAIEQIRDHVVLITANQAKGKRTVGK